MKAFLVDEIESEAGYGQRLEDQYLFPTEELAKEFVKAYNEKHNNQSTTPSWYMYQKYIGEVDVTPEIYEKKVYKGDLVIIPNIGEK